MMRKSGELIKAVRLIQVRLRLADLKHQACFYNKMDLVLFASHVFFYVGITFNMTIYAQHLSVPHW